MSKIESNPRGIPKAPFVNDVIQYIGGEDAEVDGALKQFQEMAAKYRYMEISIQQKKKSLDIKIPDIKKTLNVVKYMKEKRDNEDNDDNEDNIETLFELHDTLYSKAKIEQSDDVYLWLGANTMLSYPIDEAIELLENKLKLAQIAFNNAIEDLEYLREQTTITDVNTARIWNFDVKRRRSNVNVNSNDEHE